MKYLSEEELSLLPEFDRQVYALFCACLTEHPALPIDHEHSGFHLLPDDEVNISEPAWFVGFTCRFSISAYPELSCSFGSYPEGVDMSFESCSCGHLYLSEMPDRNAFLAEITSFLNDWLEGRIVVRVRSSAGRPYRTLIERRGRVLGYSHAWFYNYFGHKSEVCLRCGG